MAKTKTKKGDTKAKKDTETSQAPNKEKTGPKNKPKSQKK